MQLNFKTYGSGPALLILHGLFGSLDNWVSHARHLQEHFTVYLIDQRNHGKSPHSNEWSYEVMAEDLLKLMEDEGIYQGHLLGHSMGGKTVMQFAALYPEYIDKLIVADMAPHAYPPQHTEIIKSLTELPLDQFDNRPDIDKWLMPRIPEVGIRLFLLKNLKRNGEEGFAWKFNLPVIRKNYDRVLEVIEFPQPFESPTLFIHGGKSPYVQVSDYENIQQDFPQATFTCLPESGHWLHADSPEAFRKEVLAYLL